MKTIILSILCSSLFIPSGYSQCYPDRHSTNWFDSWISCSQKPNPNPIYGDSHWILFDFVHHYKMDAMKVWNLNDPERLNWGIRELDVDYSLDSMIWEHAGVFTLDKAEGTNRYEGMNWVGIDIPEARYVLLTSRSNYGSSCAGLSEIRFSAEKVQIPVDVDNQTGDRSEIHVYAEPNPFTDLFRLNVELDAPATVDIQITDMFGRQMYQDQMEVLNQFGSIKIPCKKWLSGAYVLVARSGAHVRRIHLIKL